MHKKILKDSPKKKTRKKTLKISTKPSRSAQPKGGLRRLVTYNALQYHFLKTDTTKKKKRKKQDFFIFGRKWILWLKCQFFRLGEDKNCFFLAEFGENRTYSGIPFRQFISQI